MKNLKFWSKTQDTIKNLKWQGGLSKIKFKPLGKRKKLLKSLGITGIAILVIVIGVAIASYLYLVKPAYSLVSSAKMLKKDGQLIGKSLQGRDLVAAGKALTLTEEDLKRIRTQRDQSFGWVKNIKLLKLNEYYSDSDHFINAGLYAIDAMREMMKVITPFADAAGLKVVETQQIKQEEGLMEAFQTWVSIMPQVASQMDGVIMKMAKVGDELQPVNVDKYPVKIGKIYIRDNIRIVKDTLSKADDFAPDIKQALTLFPGVLGVGSPLKRYMIIMQNDKELRPTGGFMTNYATFKIKDALLQSDFTSKDMYSIDNTIDIIDATYDFPDAPPAYMKYLKVERWYARDMNSSPDFIDSMDQLMRFYNMAGRINPFEIKPVNGVFTIDTYVIKELLDVTGPVTVNGITYTGDNVILELEKLASLQLKEQIGRKKVLGDLMESMLVNVFESDKNLWPKLIEKGIDLARRKHVLVYLFDPLPQKLIEEYGFGGRVKEAVEGDYSFVVSTNLGGDKTNWFTTKEVTHELSKQGDKWIDTVKIKYNYKNPTGDYALFAKRFRDWVRVYTPLNSQIQSVTGTEDGSTTGQERGKTYFTGEVELGPGETKEMTFKYVLPQNVVKPDKYVLTIQKQPGIDVEVHKVIVNGKTETINLSADKTITIRL